MRPFSWDAVSRCFVLQVHDRWRQQVVWWPSTSLLMAEGLLPPRHPAECALSWHSRWCPAYSCVSCGWAEPGVTSSLSQGHCCPHPSSSMESLVTHIAPSLHLVTCLVFSVIPLHWAAASNTVIPKLEGKLFPNICQGSAGAQSMVRRQLGLCKGFPGDSNEFPLIISIQHCTSKQVTFKFMANETTEYMSATGNLKKK